MTLPTKNGHAPRDPLNQERAINLSILAMSQPGKFSRVESNSTPGGALRPCLFFMFNVLSALPV